MEKYFNVFLEFDKHRVHQVIDETIEKGQKGYVCAIESNNLTVANKDHFFLSVVNNALINVCDGSVLAAILSKIHRQHFCSYIGRDLFLDFIKRRRYKHLFLGNTQDILTHLQKELSLVDPRIADMLFLELPFCSIDEFNYPEIANIINQNNADIIWISLGAPKQEFFMSRILPFLNRGVLFGIGAAFNFLAKTGPVRCAPGWMLKMKIEWLHRAWEEPGKNIPRYWNFIKMLPKLVKEERGKRKKVFV